MSSLPCWGRATELLFAQQQQIVTRTPVCWLPWATYTTYGNHLPFGTPGFITTAIVERAAQRVGGVVYPVLWRDLDLDINLFRQMLTARLTTVAGQAFQIAVVVGRSENTTDDLSIIEVAESAQHQHRILVLAVSPFELVDEQMQDHGAIWETSLMLAIRPDLVDVNQIVDHDGQDVRHVASPSLGQQALHLAGERLAVAVRDLLERRDTSVIAALYQQRRVRYTSQLL
ncbi:creatininase family protein [Chloroflexus sp. MS-CIW-1]|uniref:creatininase family protein n=1 Tax=Chloroflexus sp. MS-CIW-1 TaxID=3055768 RepID=UPI0026489897|nr:creatininase family protein [Chloroflexus sp. MS-CIW-1]MDN5271314.1 creatininase family protein [Chloroflexus sp. MS-CIW-1]